MKSNKGITLIALIITIVVLLIIAVVAIGAAQDSNIVGYAQNAAGKYEEGKGLEDNAIAGYENMLNKYANGGNSVGGSSVPNNGGTTNNPSEGNNGNNPEVGPEQSEPTPTPEPTPVTYPTYEMGDTVTIGTESFYVIETSNETQETVVLLAKERINTSTYKQSASASSISFSSTNYWASEFTSSPYDLVEIGEPSADHYAAYHAYKYAKTIDPNATGRLMTYLEARTIRDTSDSLRNVIFGTESTSGRVNYWLGSANDSKQLNIVDGGGKVLSTSSYHYDTFCGVRPVVIISKDRLN